MLRYRRLFISLMSALAAAALVYGVYVMLLRQVELQKTVRVIVPRQFITAGTVLTEDMLEAQSIMAASVDDQMYTELSGLIGKQTLIPLGEGEPVLDWKLASSMLLPTADEATFEIPKDYIRSISGAVRPGDLVRIYLSDESGRGRRLLAEDVRVASVRLSNGGREDAVEGSPSQVADNRQQLMALRAARQVERINLNLTEEEWLTIDRACQQPEDGKLIIALPGEQVLDTALQGGGDGS